METIKEQLHLAVKPYGDRWLRLVISLIAAHYILSHTHHYEFWEVIFVKGYFVSLLCSFIIAYVLVESVHQITRRLDLKIPYSKHWKIRTALQILFGVVWVSILAFLLACTYFLAFGQLERWRRYLDMDFPMIAAFIIGINAYYFIFYLLRIIVRLIKYIYHLRKNNKTLLLRHKKPGLDRKRSLGDSSIAFIVLLGRKYRVVYMDGSSGVWHISLKMTMQELNDHDYFMLNSGCIINRAAIHDTHYISSKRYHVNIIPSLHDIVPDDCFIVSQQRKRAFEEWI